VVGVFSGMFSTHFKISIYFSPYIYCLVDKLLMNSKASPCQMPAGLYFIVVIKQSVVSVRTANSR